jgi:hypothetical protein
MNSLISGEYKLPPVCLWTILGYLSVEWILTQQTDTEFKMSDSQ